jgi:hypothetical protein
MSVLIAAGMKHGQQSNLLAPFHFPRVFAEKYLGDEAYSVSYGQWAA